MMLFCVGEDWTGLESDKTFDLGYISSESGSIIKQRHLKTKVCTKVWNVFLCYFVFRKQRSLFQEVAAEGRGLGALA